MPTSGHKFLRGLMVGSSARKVEELLKGLADAEGNIDTDTIRYETIRNLLKEGVQFSGDKVTFTIGDDSVRWLVKPVNVNITSADFDEALTKLESKYA